jgi:uncharacterized membrane protein (UPF0127 family)
VAQTAPVQRAERAAETVPAAQPLVVLEPPGRDPVTVRVEIARSYAETRRGLMFREELAPDAGMLFLFRRPREQTFWMLNTPIPLDMIFIGSDMRVLGVVENAEPRSGEERGVDGDSQFVLEVNGGFARAHGIGAGTRVRFEHVDDVPPPAPPIRGEGRARQEEEWR